jgi:serine/threonine protein kinase
MIASRKEAIVGARTAVGKGPVTNLIGPIMRAIMPLVPGTRLGAYEIVDLAGTGGMGEVYRARDIRLNRTVALKLLPTGADA